MALIRVESPRIEKLRPLAIVDEEIRRGEKVAAFGYPGGTRRGRGLKLTRGIVSSLPEQTNNGMLLLDCRVNPGNSGGPLLNTNGEVIGMNTFKKTKSEGLNFAVSIIDILQQLKVARPSTQLQQGLNACGNRFST